MKNVLLQTILIYGNWYHSYDISVSFGTLLSRKKLVYIHNPDVNTIMKSIEKLQVNEAYLIPSALDQMLTSNDDGEKHTMESLNRLCTTGASLSTETIEGLRKRFTNLQHIVQVYGCTEAAAVSAQLEDQMSRLKPYSVGKISPGFTLKVVNMKTEERLGPYQNGEIRYKSPAIIKGYMGVDSSTHWDKEGFFKSGDLGYYDDDECVFLVGRLKEIINYNGYAIVPAQIEQALLQHRAVLEAGVIGKPAPDVEELPTAFIVKQPGVHVTAQELIDYVAKEVSSYMQLRGGVIFVPQLPKTPTGKLQRRCLKEMLERHIFDSHPLLN